MDARLVHLGNVIAFAVQNDRNGLMSFLQRNGVFLDDKAITDKQLIEKTADSLVDSQRVRDNFIDLVATKTGKKSGFANGFGDPLPSADPLPTSTSSGSSFWSGFGANSVASLLTTGLGFIGQNNANNAQASAIKAQANAQLAAAQAAQAGNLTNLEIAKMQLAAAQAQPKSSNMGIIIGISVVGVLLLVGVVYMVTRASRPNKQ